MTVEEWLGADNTLGIDIWHRKYQYEDETFDEWLDRITAGDQDVKDLIIKKKFLFGGRILSNRGLDKKGIKVTLSNCYVVSPPEDNIESIYDTAGKLARTYSYGGGCGIDISNLSPRGAKVNNTAKYTSGAVSFMETYSQVTEQIGQNGRRGALMISLDCTHPDLLEFIDIKTDLTKVNKANISLKVNNEFMNAVEQKKTFTLSFTREATGEEITKEIDASEIFKRFAENNWNYGEPGCLFWDRVTTWNLLALDPDFEYAGTNPCGEEPLPAGGSCSLSSLNLSAFVNEQGIFDIPDFIHAVKIAVRAQNKILDEGMDLHPLQEQRASVKNWRQIGIGVMGIADMLIKMGITYGSPKSIEVCEEIAKTLIHSATMESCSLAIEDGPYPMCKSDLIVQTDFFKNYVPEGSVTYELVKKHGLRNSQLLTIAPTGTLSTMLGISGGIEPIFANYYTRKTESLHGKDVYYKVYTPIVQEYMNKNNIEDDSELPEYFITANDISYKNRIAMQAIWQKYIDASISSTVNLPNDTTIEDVYDLYLEAWKAGLKGITVFRDGCARVAVLTTDNKEEDKESDNILNRGYIIPASNNLIGLKRKLVTGCGSLHCTAFFDPESKELREVYLSKGSTGGCNNFMTGLSRMISLSARGGVSINDIIDQLKSTGSCPSYAVRSATKHDTSMGACCPMAIANALADMYKEFTNAEYGMNFSSVKPNKDEDDNCPVCGSPLTFEGGCNICKNCGWSRCD